MRKINSILLVVFLLLSVTGGQYFIYKVHRWHLRKQASSVLRNMADEEAQRIVFSKREFRHGLPFTRVPDKSDEIIFRGEFYDVKTVALTADSVVLFAYCDREEKALVNEYMRSAREDDNSPVDDLLEYFSAINIFITNSDTHTTCTRPAVLLLQDYYNSLMQSVYLSDDSPPPQNLV